MTVENWTRTDLERLLGQEEGSSLEFKHSAALQNTEQNKKELVKDVTALANAAGGIIVYGIEEENGVAVAIDDGCEVTPEWIEQILDSNAEPKLVGVHVQRIGLGNGRHAFAIEVPQARAPAPHQSKQHHRYFRRHGRKVLPMLDHEIRDVMRRGEVPDLYLAFQLEHSRDDTYKLRIVIGNHSTEPALYGSATVGLHPLLTPPARVDDFRRIEVTVQTGDSVEQLAAYQRHFMVPHHLPIFRESEWLWWSGELTIAPNSRLPVFQQVTCPGFRNDMVGWLERGGDLAATINWPRSN